MQTTQTDHDAAQAMNDHNRFLMLILIMTSVSLVVGGIAITLLYRFAEIRAPFNKAGLFATGSALFVIFLGSVLFLRISDPILKRLRIAKDQLEQRVRERTAELEAANRRLGHEITERRQIAASLETSDREWQDTSDANICQQSPQTPGPDSVEIFDQEHRLMDFTATPILWHTIR